MNQIANKRAANKQAKYITIESILSPTNFNLEFCCPDFILRYEKLCPRWGDHGETVRPILVCH